ncbi:MAG: hypothetical protein AAF658_00670, partial [Myxococcota bacterium]
RPAMRGLAPSAVRQSDKSVLRAPILPLDVSIDVVGHSDEYRAVGIASDGLVVVGARPLPLHTLTRVVVGSGSDSSFELWCNAVLCESAVDAHRVELRPFALNGVVKQRFNDLYYSAKAD